MIYKLLHNSAQMLRMIRSSSHPVCKSQTGFSLLYCLMEFILLLYESRVLCTNLCGLDLLFRALPAVCLGLASSYLSRLGFNTRTQA